MNTAVKNKKRSSSLKKFWAKKKQAETGGINLDLLVDRMVIFCQKVARIKYYKYQEPFARRFIESIIKNEGAEITAEWARQSGKSETIASCIAGLLIMIPIFARALPQVGLLKYYIDGIYIGVFAPSDEQASTIHNRVNAILNSEEISNILESPDIGVEINTAGNEIRCTNGSICRKHSLDERAKIESKTYHVICIDEAQDANTQKVRRDVHGMGAHTNATITKTGVAGTQKCDFLEAINRNKRNKLNNARSKQNHFELDHKIVQKYNPRYKKYIKSELERIGEDSDEFQRNYYLKWNLEQGMFITFETFEKLGRPYARTKFTEDICIAGLDLGKQADSTVFTVISEYKEQTEDIAIGYEVVNGKLQPTYKQQNSTADRLWKIINWDEIHGEDWEAIFEQIVRATYNFPNLSRIVVDATGLGDPIYDRLNNLLAGTRIEVMPFKMGQISKSELYKNLDTMINRELIFWPNIIGVQNTKEYKRFNQQMQDLEKSWRGQHLVVAHPNERGAHDDYPDSLALACWGAREDIMPEVDASFEQGNPFISKERESMDLMAGYVAQSPAGIGIFGGRR